MSQPGIATKRNVSRSIVSSSGCFILSTFALAAASSTAAGGLVGGGGVHTWDGSVSSSWNTAGNWNTNQVPGAGDYAIINGGPTNVLLNANSAQLRGLFLTGARSLSNNGFVLKVTDGDGETTVNGLDSTLFVAPGGAPHGFETDVLAVEQGARLQMAGGWAFVHEQLTLASGGRVSGNGYIDITSANPAAFNGANGSDITVSGGDLRIAVFGGGSIVLPDTVNVMNASFDLMLLGPLMLPVQDLNLGASGFSPDHDWTLAGELSADPGNGNTSRIGGSASADIEGVINIANSGRLLFDTPVTFENGSQVNIAAGATMELDEAVISHAGHVTVISHGGRLQLDGQNSLGGWDGDIVSNAGIIESNNAFGIRIDGELQLGSFGGLRTVIGGANATRVNGPVSAPGLGAIVDSTLDVMAGAAVNLGANAALIINGDLIIRDGSTMIGDGHVEIYPGGELWLQDGATVAVDVVNAGEVHAGMSDSADAVAVFGSYSQSGGGRMIFDIAGAAFQQQDFFDIDGDAVIAGELDIALADGFEPETGQQFFVLTASSVEGEFDAVTGAAGFSVEYTPTAVIVTFEGAGIPGDINGDDVVDIDDLFEVINAWGSCADPADCPADIAPYPGGDDVVDIDDLFLVINNWS